MTSRTERNSGSGPKLHDSGGNYRADCQAAVEKGEPRLVSNPEDAGAGRKIPEHLRLDQQLTATKPEGGGGERGTKKFWRRSSKISSSAISMHPNHWCLFSNSYR